MPSPNPPPRDRFLGPSGDVWYVRFPDGRVLRAANTGALRKQLHSGRIPSTSTVRRSPDQEWVTLEWTEELADLVKKPAAGNGAGKPAARKRRRVVQTGKPISASGRLDPRRLNLVGSRGILREMLAALDGTLLPKKLAAAGYAGLAFGALAALSRVPWPDLGAFQAVIPWVLGIVALFVFAFLSGVLTRMTFIELSELRPAQKREGVQGAAGRTVRLLGALAFGVGGVVVFLALLRWATAWLVAPVDWPWPLARAVTAEVLTVLNLVLEFVLGPLCGLALLLAPILVVEECSVFQALRTWRGLLRQHFRSVLAYEVIAAAVAAAITLPFALPLLLGGSFVPEAAAASVTRAALWGFLLALPAAYLIVANVFIYLNVRYETVSEQAAAVS